MARRAQKSAPVAPTEADPFPPRVPRTGKKGSGGYRPAPTPAQLLANARKYLAKGTKTGRPTSYTPEVCDIVVGLGAQGLSKASIAHVLGISVDTLYAWSKEFPAFSEALARAHAASQHWWEQHGQRHLTADRYQAQVWHRSMAARFNEYKDVAPSVNVAIGTGLLDAIGEATAARSARLADAAKPVEAQDVVLVDRKTDT